MNSEIVIIAYDAYNARLAGEAAEESGRSVDVCLSAPDSCAQKAEELEKSGARVLITFGMFAKVIRQRVTIPVVLVDVSAATITEALIRAAGKGRRIAVIGFKSVLSDILRIRPLLKIDLISYPVCTPKEMPAVIAGMKDKQIDVLIGGPFQASLAEKYGIRCEMFSAEKNDILEAIRSARAFLEQRGEDAGAFHSFDYLHVGSLSVDESGRVLLMNREAAECLGISQFTGGAVNIREICPQMMTDILTALREHKNILNRIVQLDLTVLLYHVSVIEEDQELHGAMVTIQDVHDIHEAENSIRRTLTTRENRAVYTFEDIIGESPALTRAVEIAFRYANTEQTVLLLGESGTGKELFAQSIHMASRRKKAPFVAVNCAALPENILESELFGYVSGAFTGALREGNRGLFETAHSGTIFLDEIGEISLSLQGKLLRVLQEHSIRRLGDDKPIPVDIRVIAATNRDLVSLVREGKFREDLYFRVNVLCLRIPPLRDRGEDILLLAEHDLREASIKRKKHFSFSEAARRKMLAYYWPGNIRELENMISRITVISDQKVLGEDLVEEYMQENRPLYEQEDGTLPETVPVRLTAVQALEQCGGSRTRAAALLRVSRSTFYRMLDQEKNRGDKPSSRLS